MSGSQPYAVRYTHNGTMGCEVCKDLQLPISLHEEVDLDQVSSGVKETLSASAKTCVSCSILWEAVEKFEESHGRIHSNWNLRRRNGILGISYGVVADEHGESSKWTRVIDLYFTGPQDLPEWPALGEAKDIPDDVSSERNLAELKKGLERCISDHGSCQTQTDLPLPTRVIDVSADPVRLCETGQRKGKYIALSHCWGAYQPLRTLESNYNDHRTEIPMKDLPKTFKDAVFVTRYLGVDYLWIDSLCIIQDSAEDWQKESSLMASVYGNAYVALLATASRDGRGGLFNGDGPKMTATLRRTTAEGREIVVRARSSIPHKPHASFEVNLGDPDLPLLERSWCFQEYILSPRIAQFTRDEIIWQCESTQCCNCGTMLRMPGGRESLKGQILDARANRHGDAVQKYCTASGRLHAIWWNLVKAYTTKLLTFDADKLPALSGVAKYMLRQQRPGDAYLAGMWRSGLADELFWRAMPLTSLRGERVLRTPAHRPARYRAPSWSWASVNARIGHLGKANLGPDRCAVLDARCEPAGLDPTGSVRGGHLLVEGLLTEAEAWFEEGEDEGLGMGMGTNRLRLVEPAARALPELVWQADVPAEADNGALDPLAVAVLWWTFESQEEARALVLRPTGEPRTFQRLGMLETDEAYCEEDYDWDEIQEFLEGVTPVQLTIV